MKLTRNIGLFLAAAIASALAFAYAVDPAATGVFLQHAFSGDGSFSLADAGAVSLTAIAKAIEESNKAFEQFKVANDERINKLLADKGGQGDDLDKMHASFADVTKQNAEIRQLLETIEAKGNRRALPGGEADVTAEQTEHKKAFSGYLRKGVEFDKALEVKALNIGTGSDGGYAVPKVIDSTIDALVVNVSPIRAISNVVQISTSDYHKLVNTRGTASGWVGEAAARTSSTTPSLADIVPPMGELYAFPQATQQMLDDVFFNAEQWLADNVATEFARAEGAAFVTGTGVNQPMGFCSGPTPVTTADATRAFGTLQYQGTGSSGAFRTLSSTVNPVDDLFALVSLMKAAYRQGSVWVMNKATLFQVAAMKDYQGRYVFSPISAPGVAQQIMNYPVVEAEDMATYSTASALAIAFGNFKLGYLVVDRIGTRVIRDPFSNKPYIGFYTTKRVGGTVVNSEAIKLLKMA